MKSRLLCSLVLMTGCVGQRPPDTNPWSDVDLDCESYSISIGDKPSLEIDNGHGSFDIRPEGGGYAVTRDGENVADTLVSREGNLLTVADEAGTTVLMLGTFGPARKVARQLVYSPDIDPASVNRRFGFTVERLDARVGRQTGLDPDSVAVVAKVCPSGPVHAGGLLRDVTGQETTFLTSRSTTDLRGSAANRSFQILGVRLATSLAG